MQKVRFLTNRVFWRLDLALGMSRKSELLANCLAKLEVFGLSIWHGIKPTHD